MLSRTKINFFLPLITLCGFVGNTWAETCADLDSLSAKVSTLSTSCSKAQTQVTTLNAQRASQLAALDRQIKKAKKNKKNLKQLKSTRAAKAKLFDRQIKSASQSANSACERFAQAQGTYDMLALECTPSCPNDLGPDIAEDPTYKQQAVNTFFTNFGEYWSAQIIEKLTEFKLPAACWKRFLAGEGLHRLRYESSNIDRYASEGGFIPSEGLEAIES